MGVIRNLSTAKKIIGLALFMIFILLIIAYMGSAYLGQTVDALDHMYEEELLPIAWLNMIREESRTVEGIMYQIMLSNSAAEKAALIDKMEERTAVAFDLQAQIEQTHLDAEEVKLLDLVKVKMTEYDDVVREMLRIIDTGDQQAIDQYRSTYTQSQEAVSTALRDFAIYKSDAADKVNAENQQKTSRAESIMMSLVIAFSVFALLISWFISCMISIPLKDGVTKLQALSEGDLCIEASRYEGKDEVGRLAMALNRLISNLRHLIEQMHNTGDMVAASSQQLTASAEQTKSASTQITDSIQQIAQGSEQQLQAIEESANVVDEMAKGVQQIAETASVVASASASSAQEAKAGEEALRKVIHQMDVISASVHETANVIRECNSSTRGTLGRNRKNCGSDFGNCFTNEFIGTQCSD